MSERALYCLMGVLIVVLSISLISLNKMIEKSPEEEKIYVPTVTPVYDSDGCVVSTGYVWSENKGYCVHPSDLEKAEDKCAGEDKPVCGIDGVTYASPCHAGKTRIIKFGSC